MPSTKVSTDLIEGLDARIDSRISATPPVSGIATDLSNLTAPTAANQDVLPNPDNTRALGSQTKRWTSLSTLLVKFYNSAGTFYTGLKAGAATANVEFNLPVSDGTAGQALTTDGGGNLSFTTISGGGGTGDFEADGSVPMTGNLDVGGNKIINLGTPTNPTDATTKAYVDAAVPPAGANATLSNLTAPTAANQDLLPTTTITGQSLGSNAKRWNQLWTSVFVASSGQLTMSGGGITLGTESIFSQLQNTLMSFFTSASSAVDAVSTSPISILTGNKTGGTGNSGAITVQTGTSAGGTRGKVILNGSEIDVTSKKITNLADPTTAQDAATKAYVDSVGGGGGGANTTLSNLTSPTSINQNLLPAATTTYSIGNNSLYYQDGHINNVKGSLHQFRFNPASTVGMDVSSSGASPSGVNILGGFMQTAAQLNSLGIATFSGGNASGSVYVESGNAVAGSSGSIVLKTGTATANKGKISLDAVMNLPVQATPSNIANGDMWFDGTNLNLRVAGVTRTVNLT